MRNQQVDSRSNRRGKGRGRAKVWYTRRQNLGRKILQFALLSGILILAIHLHGVTWAVMVFLIAVYLEFR